VIARCRATVSAPGLARTLIVSKCPRVLNRAWAVGSEKPASVIPARLLSDPKVTIPVIVNLLGRLGRLISTRSPTVK
jgi:hypothetical protein